MASTATLTEAIHAVADPRRRELLDLLATGERSVGALVTATDLPQPQVSKHLRVLREAGAVAVHKQGRQRLYRVDGAGLKPIYDWISAYERTWTQRFDQLDDVLDDLKRRDEGARDGD